MAEQRRIDISEQPALAVLAHAVAETRQPCRIEDNGRLLALLVPAGGGGRTDRRQPLVDTSALPPPPYRSLAEFMAGRTAPAAGPFTRDELRDAVAEERAAAWQAKQTP